MNNKVLHTFWLKLVIIVISFLPKISFSQEVAPEKSDSVHFIGAENMRADSTGFNNIKFSGNARFRQGNINFRCDVAFFYRKEKQIDAVGNIIINQGDTLFLYGDSLFYDGITKIAYVRGNVRLEKGDLTLYSQKVIYNMNTNVAAYTNEGKVISKKNNNTLTSTRGYYYSDFNKLSFKDNVILTNPDYIMKSDTLDYNENSEIAYFSGNTTITGEGNFIFCKNGLYDTRNNISEFEKDAYLISDGHKIQGDKLHYNRNNGVGIATGNIKITDTANKLIISGDYGIRNEKTNTSFVTGNTLVYNWKKTDTLFLTADTIRLKKNKTTDNNSLFAYPTVKFYKKDMQGMCDSLVYLQNDSSLKMYQEPILWSGKNQMDGDTILIQLANNKIKELNIINNAFVIDNVLLITKIKDSLALNIDKTNSQIQQKYDTIKTSYFNQIKGKTLQAFFVQDTIRHIYVNGNGQSVYFTGEDFKPKEGINKIICSKMRMDFKNNELENIIFIKTPEGKLNNITDIKEENQKLKGFHWKIEKRPESKQDLIQK